MYNIQQVKKHMEKRVFIICPEDDPAETRTETGGGLCSLCAKWASQHTGCVWCCAILLYFFIFIPMSLMLIIHGYNRGFALTIGIGVLVLCVSTCLVPGIVFGCRWWRKRSKTQRPSYRQQLTKQTDCTPTAVVT